MPAQSSGKVQLSQRNDRPKPATIARDRALQSTKGKYRGAFHSTKFSGLKFRVFHATNGTVFSGSKFGAKTEDSFTFVYLLSGCSIDDAEVKINDVLGEGDNTTYNLS